MLNVSGPKAKRRHARRGRAVLNEESVRQELFELFDAAAALAHVLHEEGLSKIASGAATIAARPRKKGR